MNDCELESLTSPATAARREAGTKAKARIEGLEKALKQLAGPVSYLNFVFRQNCVVEMAERPGDSMVDVGTLGSEQQEFGKEILQAVRVVVRGRLMKAKAEYAEL